MSQTNGTSENNEVKAETGLPGSGRPSPDTLDAESDTSVQRQPFFKNAGGIKKPNVSPLQKTPAETPTKTGTLPAHAEPQQPQGKPVESSKPLAPLISSIRDHGRTDKQKRGAFSRKSQPTMRDVQQALYKKITQYCGGIEGVWKAIDPRFKAGESLEQSGIKGIKDNGKIRRGAFRKQVARLNQETKRNSGLEKMTFGIKGNLILLMNVFEILGIKSLDDLLNETFKKEDINAINIETNINAKEIMAKLDSIYSTLTLSMNRKPRFPAQKVSRDWEAIIINLNDIIRKIETPENEYKGDELTRRIIKQMRPGKSRLAFMTHGVIKEYHAYFSQNILLHTYCKSLIGINFFNYDSNKQILLSPLYILYFFIIINKHLLSYMFGNEKTASDCCQNSGKEYGKCMLALNDDIQKHLKNIITRAEPKYININENDYKEYYEVLKDVITLFFDLYQKKTEEKEDWMDKISRSVNNLVDFYSVVALGITILFIPSKDDIEKLEDVKNRLDKIENELIRESDYDSFSKY